MRSGALGAAVLVLLVGALTGCGGGGKKASSITQIVPFVYNPTQPLAARDAGRVNKNYPVAVDDVSFTDGGQRISAYLAVPPGKGKHAAVIYVHGTGGDRRQLIVPAVWLAGRGAITLTLTMPSAEQTMPSGLTATEALHWQRDIAAEDVIAVRRAIDFLSARKDVDPNRIGFVGWSAGAKTGALLAGSEPRLHAIVLMSAGSQPLPDYAARAPVDLRPEILDVLGQVDPIRLIRRAQPDELMLQDGTKDAVVPHSALRWIVRSAPEGTTIRWYAAGHALNTRASRDQLAWLTRKLDIGPAVPGAKTGP